jgi:hypothetical protein
MRTIHHSSREVWDKHKYNFKVAHGIDLPDGGIIVTGETDMPELTIFESDGGVSLPLVFTNEPVAPQTVAALSHLGVTDKDTTMSVAVKLQKLHHEFHPRAI